MYCSYTVLQGEMMSHQQHGYDHIIRAKGGRLTTQRQIVIDALCEEGRHASLSAVTSRAQARVPAIDRSTVYRALEFLAEMGLATSALIDGEKVYELAVGQPRHHHLHCRGCGAELPVEDSLIAPLIERLSQESGFQIDAQHLILTGLCPRCQAQSEG